MTEYVVLVDHQDQAIGLAEKLEAHEQGWLHRAFSIFIFNSQNKLLLQQRANEKYHSPGLWTNTCCSHPRADETVEDAAKRRLREEMGIDCALEKKFHFTYKATLENNLIEHEFDHVFIGFTDTIPILNPHEVMDFRYHSKEEIDQWISEQPETLTEWFKICWPTVREHLP
ncbi:MAG TPA: isopentenyl-diphosphate Delta-isomerase [Luteibaculaceae bacterium]|nr:isopentenyl-diphosphate Delta-isomerase [Luteibaculaceae bacterium]